MNGFEPSPFSSLVNSIGMKFVLLPPGRFMMGSPQETSLEGMTTRCIIGCPECFSPDIEDVADEKDHGYW